MFDILKTDEELGVGCERMAYGQFFRKTFRFRTGDVSPRFELIDPQIELPINSLVHVMDNMYNRDNGIPIVDVPNLDLPFVKNEKFRKFIIHNTSIDVNGPFTSTEKFVFRTPNLDQNLRKFKRLNQFRFLFRGGIPDIPVSPNTLTIINHNPLFRTLVRGQLAHYRQFKLIMGSIINTACKIEGKTQYIVVPLSHQIYNKDKFNMAIKSEAPTAIRSKDSYHYFFMMHWLNYIDRRSTLSLFDHIPQEKRSSIVMVITVGTGDMRYALFYTLQDAYDLNNNNQLYNRFVNQLNALVLKDMGTDIEDNENTEENIDSLSTRTDVKTETTETTSQQVEAEQTFNDEQVKTEPISPVKDTNENDNIAAAIATKIDQLGKILTKTEFVVEPAITASRLDPLDYRGVSTSVEEPSDEDDFSIPEIDLSLPDIQLEDEIREGQQLQQEGTLPNVTPINTAKQVVEIGKSYIDEIDTSIIEFISKKEKITPKQKERLQRIATSYKNVKYNGKTIEEHITSSVDPNVQTNELEFIGDSLPDASMKKSSLSTFDQLYMDKFFDKDLASIAVSFNKHGMFLTGIEETVQSDELNRLRKFKFNYEDADGKKHSVKFDIPHIDENGYCFINGVRSYLRKQMVALPICKVSPVRVSLASNMNKTVVERNETKAHSFDNYIQRLINKINENREEIAIEYGTTKFNDRISYEYTSLAKIYKSLTFSDKKSRQITLFFADDEGRTKLWNQMKIDDPTIKKITKLSSKFGVPFGIVKDGKEYLYMYIEVNNIVTVYNPTTNKIELKTTILDMLTSIFDVSLSSRLDEWTDIKILDKKFPVGFLLCFQFGLRHVLQYLGVKYTLYEKRKRMQLRYSDIVIPFADRVLVIPRYPLRNSLIIAGLQFFDTKNYLLEEFDTKNVYYELLTAKGYRTNYLKGIEDHFDFFVDAPTRDVLIQMNEPTTFKDLLVRATDMLVTEQHIESSAMANHRLRSYERINAIIYNEMARQFATYRRKQGAGQKYSINPQAVLQRILQDQAMVGVENINPIHEIKTVTGFTYTGMGGRTAESFVINDRRFPTDGGGVISEATPDSQSVAINAVAPPDPIITNVRGLVKPVDINTLEPTQLLSTPALLMPGVTQDDGKRANFVSIQLSHVLPTKESTSTRVRTGYERIIAHRSSNLYSYAAKQDGKVIEVDETTNMCKIQYKDGTTHTFEFGELYGECSDIYATLKLELTVKKGDSFKRGDILCYNPQIFEKDPMSKQVDWKHGLLATIAIIDKASTYEDSNSISTELCSKLEIEPVQVRQINITAGTVVHEYKKLGEEVDISDYLMIFEDADMEDMSSISTNEETLHYLARLNRKTPKAKFAGKIVDVEAFYSCPLSEMHPSLAKCVKEIIKPKLNKHKFSQGSINGSEFPVSQPLPEGTKFKNVKFEKDTVVIRYRIKEKIAAGVGDKLVIGSALKTVIAEVHEDARTESGKPIDVFFSGSSICNRIINSAPLVGIAESILEEMETQVTDIYFGK